MGKISTPLLFIITILLTFSSVQNSWGEKKEINKILTDQKLINNKIDKILNRIKFNSENSTFSGNEFKDIEKILNQQQKINSKINIIKKSLNNSNIRQTTTTDNYEYLADEIEDFSNRLDKVERKSILDRIKLGGELRTRIDQYAYKDNLVNNQKKDGHINELWSNRLRLNMRSDITQNLIFHGRLSYFKLSGDTNYSALLFDSNKASIPDPEGNIHVERAYVDYFLDILPVSFTVGRIPTSEGPPSEFRENTTRKATWPKLFLDGENDGIILNIDTDNITGLNNSMFRITYSKSYQNFDNYKGITIDDTRTIVFAYETEIPTLDDSILWASFGKIWDVRPLIELDASTGLSVLSYPENTCDVDLYNLHLQLKNIRNSGLDFFFSYSYQKINPLDHGTVLGMDISGVGVVPVIELGLYSDNLSGNLGEKRYGYAIYTGIRYEMPIKSLNYPKIGFEYNYSSKHFLGAIMISGSGEIINKLGINGSVFELYYIQPLIKKHMFLRVGGVYFDYNYYNPNFIWGSQAESDMTVKNSYILMDIRF